MILPPLGLKLSHIYILDGGYLELLNLTNMAPAAKAQLSALNKSDIYGHIYQWAKNYTGGTIWLLLYD